MMGRGWDGWEIGRGGCLLPVSLKVKMGVRMGYIRYLDSPFSAYMTIPLTSLLCIFALRNIASAFIARRKQTLLRSLIELRSR